MYVIGLLTNPGSFSEELRKISTHLTPNGSLDVAIVRTKDQLKMQLQKLEKP